MFLRTTNLHLIHSAAIVVEPLLPASSFPTYSMQHLQTLPPSLPITFPPHNHRPNPLRLNPGMRDLKVMPKLHILWPRLEQPHLISRQPRQRQEKLGVGQLHPQAPSRPPAETVLILPQRLAGLSKPALRVERPRVREKSRVCVDAERRHTDRRVGRDGVGGVVEGFERGGAGVAACEAESEAIAFVDEGGEVGEPLEGGGGRRGGEGM